MSSLFNQTNIAPKTSFYGSNGTSNFPSGLNISAGGANPNYLVATSGFGTGVTTLGVLAQETPNFITAPIAANNFQAWDFLGQNQYANYSAAAITYVNNSNGGVANFLSENITNNSNANQTNLVFQMRGMSSIQAGNYVINAEAFCSTVKGNNWG